MTEIKLRRIATLVTDSRDGGQRPFVALEHVESGTGRLADDELPDRLGPAPGVATVKAGDLLFGKLRPYLAKSWLVDVPVYASTEFLALRPKNGVANRWLAYVCRTTPFIDWAVATSQGAKMPRTSWERLGEYQLELPSLDAQLAVVRFLDSETARIHQLIKKKRLMGGLLRNWLNAARARALAGVDSGTEKLKHVARMESGHTPDKGVPDYWENCNIPWVTLNDVGRLEEDEVFANPLNFINPLGLANSSARVLPEGTVILSRDATVGRAALLGAPMAISQHFVGWICGPSLLPEYLLEVLRGPLQQLLQSLSFGSTIPTIGVPELRDLVIPVPPLREQRNIAIELLGLRNSVDRAIALIASQVDRLVERRQALITAAVTGQLDVAAATV